MNYNADAMESFITEGELKEIWEQKTSIWPVSYTHLSSEMDLTDLLEYIKGKNYNCKEVLYVDTDLSLIHI